MYLEVLLAMSHDNKTIETNPVLQYHNWNSIIFIKKYIFTDTYNLTSMELNTRLRLPFLFVPIFFLTLISCTHKQNWPQFRGPDCSMTVEAANLPEEWGNDKNIKWSAELDGTGWSSPIVWGDKVFITSAFPEKVNPVPERGPTQGPPPQGGQGQQPGQPLQQGQEPQPGPPPRPGQGPQGQQAPQPEVRDTTFKEEIYRWELICFDLSTGKELWRQISFNGNPKAGKNPGSTYACETPVTDGKRIFAYFGMNGLYCYDIDGKLLWQKEFEAYYTQRGWGTGSSPALYRDLLFIQFDNEENSFIVALNAATGEEKWRVQRDEKTSYSTPYIWKNKKRTELIAGGKSVRSYDPETGKILWELKAGGEQVIPSPVGNEELLFIGNAAGRGETKAKLFAVKAGVDGDITDTDVAWVSEESGLGNPSPLLYKGLIYVIGGRGEIAVLDAATGALKYQKRINGIGSVWASPWANNDRIYFLDEKGVTRVFKAGETFEQLAENKLEGKFWSSVAIAGNSYILKGVGKLYCIGK